jgi:hypothetical protein
LQQKLLIVTALAALIGLAMVTRAPVVAASPHRAKPRVGASARPLVSTIGLGSGWIFVAKDDCLIMLGECPDDMHLS